MRRKRLTIKERKLVKGVLAGKTPTQAAREAGYTESSALKKAGKILERPIVASFITQALEEAGLTPQEIVKPIIDALKAKCDDRADHALRLKAYDRVAAAYGAIPTRVEMPDVQPSLNVTIMGPGGQKEAVTLRDKDGSGLPSIDGSGGGDILRVAIARQRTPAGVVEEEGR